MNSPIGTTLAFVISLFVQVGYPLAVTLYFRRRTRARWQLFAYGAIVFAMFQLFTWVPLSVYLETVIGSRLSTGTWDLLWLLASALITSLIEELGRWWGYRHLFPRGSFRLTWQNGVMYGLGHGSLETVLLVAGLTFIYFLAYALLSRMGLEVLEQSMGDGWNPAIESTLQAIINTSWEQPLTVALERILALPHQVSWSLLVMQSCVLRQKRWFGFAVLYHFSIGVIVPGLVQLTGFTAAEGANIVFALLSLWIILKLRAVSLEGE